MSSNDWGIAVTLADETVNHLARRPAPTRAARERVLVVEDDPDIADAVRRGLLFAGFAVDLVTDGRAALTEVQINPPAVVVLDIMLPDVDGLEVCRRIRASEAEADRPPLPILMLTARDAVPDRVVGLEAGADDYLIKPFAFEELVARINVLLRRAHAADGSAPSGVLQFADVTLDPSSRTVARRGRLVPLTTREFDLLALLLQHPNQVLSRSILMDRFWTDYFGESNVLEVAMAALRRALEAGGAPRLIHTVRGVGYALRVPRDDDP
jgi:two-component system response regulator MprA